MLSFSLLNFLDILYTNKIVIVGGISVICEIIVIVFNTIRKLRAINKRNMEVIARFLAPTKVLTVDRVLPASQADNQIEPISWKKVFFWAANPVNLLKDA